MHKQGFYLSLEAALSLSVMILILSVHASPEWHSGMAELHTYQQMNDLFRVWQSSQTTNPEILIRDTNFMFAGRDFDITVNGAEIFAPKNPGNRERERKQVSGKIYAPLEEWVEITLRVYD